MSFKRVNKVFVVVVVVVVERCIISFVLMSINYCLKEHTAISEKVVIVNSPYWNRKELWV